MKKRLSLLKKLGFGLGIGLAVIASILVTSQFHNTKSSYALAGSTWLGTIDNKFSTAGNWSGNAVPTSGQNIILPATGAGSGTKTLIDDLGYPLGSITLDNTNFQGATAGAGAVGSGYVISPDPTAIPTGIITLAAGSAITTTATAPTINTTLTIPSVSVTGNLSIDGLGVVTVNTLNVSGTLTATSTFSATSISTGTLTGAGAFTTTSLGVTGADSSTGAYIVNGTYTYSGGSALNISHSIHVATLSMVGADLTVSGGTPIIGAVTTATATNVTVSGGTPTLTSVTTGTGNMTISGGSLTSTTLTVGGNLTVGTSFANTPTTIAVTGTLTASVAFTAGTVTASTLTGSGAFTATSITAGTLNTSGTFTTTTLTVSTADTATNSYTVNGTYTYSPATLLTVSQAIHVGTLTVSTGSLTINTNFSNQPTAINVPAGTLTASVAFTAGTVTASTLTGSGAFTATSITAGTLNTSGAFTTGSLTVSTADTATAAYTVSGTYTYSPATTLTVSHAISVGTLSVPTGSLTISNIFATGNSPTINVTTGTLTASAGFSAGAVTTANLAGTSSFTATSLHVTNADTSTGGYNVSGTYTFDGASLTIQGTTSLGSLIVTAGNLTISSSSTFTVTNNLTVATGTLTMNKSFSVGGTLTVNSALTVSQPITVTTLTVTGNLTETSIYSASTVNVTGIVTVLNNGNYGDHKYDITGTLVVGTDSTHIGSISLADATNVTGAVTVNAGSNLYQDAGASITLASLAVKNGASVTLDGTVNYPVTFGSGNSQVSPVLAYNVATATTDSNGNRVYNTLEFKGTTTLLNDLQLQIGGNAVYGTVNFSGPITYNGFGITTTNSDGTLLIGGVQAHNPGVTNTYTGNLPGDSLNINDNETAIITGTRGYVYGYRGSMVKGTGTVLGLNLSYGAAVTPGNSPGTLTALNWLYMQQTSVFNAELKSTSAYDQLAVGSQYDGSSNGGSAVVLHNNPILNVSLLSGYSMANGDKFTIISNQSGTPVNGIFNGLTEGSTFKVADGTFSISYVGGTSGHDVVLTVISAPSQPVTVKAPNTGVQFLTTHPVLLVVLGGITAGFFLVLAIRRRVTQ